MAKGRHRNNTSDQLAIKPFHGQGCISFPFMLLPSSASPIIQMLLHVVLSGEHLATFRASLFRVGNLPLRGPLPVCRRDMAVHITLFSLGDGAASTGGAFEWALVLFLMFSTT